MIEKIRIPHLGILVTTYCNLNCRNCADLIPKRERKHYEAACVKQDFRKILEAAEFIEEVLVIGGEVILYPELEEILDFFAQQPQVGKIIITTNASIVPNDRLLECFKRNKVLVRMSGYPDYVVPNREEVVKKYKEAGVGTEDLEHMVWVSMGEAKKRNRSEEQMCKVFQTCSMKECVSINSDGKIFYCSRQMAAMELPFYPDPEESEYIDVRNAADLTKCFQRFYQLPYINTCDYCDGIGCATLQAVNTATQILDKAVYLDAVAAYEILKNSKDDGKKEDAVEIIYHILRTNIKRIIDFKEAVALAEELERFVCHDSKEGYGRLAQRLKNLLDVLAYDYHFAVSKNVPYASVSNVPRTQNQITVGMYPEDTKSDLLLTADDILQALNEKYPIDEIVYNKLFVESKLKRLETEATECIVSGLSYTQYGILEHKMPFSTVNLSITGEDTPYSIRMAQYALKLNPNVKSIVIPMTYYQGCYDMSADESILHKNVVTRINMPILKDAGNDKDIAASGDGYIIGNPLKIYEIALDLDAARKERDSEIRSRLAHMEYFNEIHPQNAFGGLKFDFHKLASGNEKFASAKITAEHNERVCKKEGYREVKKYLEPFLDATACEGKKVLIFVPPMTEYLYESYHKELKEFFYHRIVPVLERYDHVIFKDWAADRAFQETDFCDFEHLNDKGAEKLTGLIRQSL